jgi:hypothetical protein
VFQVRKTQRVQVAFHSPHTEDGVDLREVRMGNREDPRGVVGTRLVESFVK